MAKLKPHPPPLPASTSLDLRLLIVEVDQPLFRIHQTVNDPVFFGRTTNYRFDAPAKEFGVLYVGRTERGAFIETLGQDTGVRLLDWAELAKRSLSTLRANRPLRVVDLTGRGLPRLGADARLHACEHHVAQSWSRAIHAHPEQPDGILYRARHDPDQICVAIYGRAANAVTVASHLGSLDDSNLSALVSSLLDYYDFGIA
jgi:hypothetical protein